IRRGPGCRSSTTACSSSGASWIFVGRERPDRQRVDPVAWNVAQRAVYQPLAFESRLAGEGDALDHHGEVRFATAVVAHVAMVAGAVVDYVEPRWQEGFLQQRLDLTLHGSGQSMSPGLSLRASSSHHMPVK